MSDQGDYEADGLQKRRNSLERYQPGAYFNEEREKLRRRAHFGERKLENDSSKNGRGGRGRKRGGGHRRPEKIETYREPVKDEIDSFEELQVPPLLNWADDEDFDDPPPPVVEKTEPKPKEDEVQQDLRQKLNAMRVNGNNGHHQQQRQRQQISGPNNRKSNGYGLPSAKPNPGANNKSKMLPRPKRNTENFDPSHAAPEMRILCATPGLKRYNRTYTTRDVLVVSDLFGPEQDLSVYGKLLNEIQNCGVDEKQLWQSWHGDSHMIADNKRRWKDACPTFHWVVDTLADYFQMDVKATRLNWYRDSSEWKPFHHDAAAVKPHMAKTQNFTAAVSFGAERDAAFEHAQTKTVIAMPQPNGTVYTFGKDVNILWRHGIPQLPPEKRSSQGRISIIVWGWMPMEEL